MVQGFAHFCPRCGAELAPGSQTCPRCGLEIARDLADLETAPQAAVSSSPQAQPSQRPDSPSLASQQQWSPPPSSPQPPQFVQPQQQPQFVPPPSSLPQQPARTLDRRRLGLVLGLALVLLLLGGAVYFGWNFLGLGKAVQPTITTTTLNSTLPYAGVDVTVLNAQQAQSFIDDPKTATDGMLRLHLQAQNKATVPVNLAYTTIAHVVLPGGKTVAPVYVQANPRVAPGATQAALLDFPVPQNTRVAQVTFRLGSASEAQLDLPLTGQSDPGRYAPKTVSVNKKVPGEYLGLDWTLVSATTQMSLDGRQASKGMRYVIVSLKVDNPLTQTAIAGSAFDYVRMKAGATTATPADTTLPVAFAAGANGKTGTVTFQVPQNATTLTLILTQQGGFQQSSLDFQV